MRARALTLTGAALGLGALVLVLVLVLSQPAVSFRRARYQHWPHGAIVRLTNHSREPIRYVAERGDTPAGDPVLCLEKSADRWINKSRVVLNLQSLDPKSGTAVRILYSAARKGLALPSAGLEMLDERELGPGQSVDFFVRVDPGAPAKKVGTIFFTPQTELNKAVGSLLFRLRGWLHLSPGVPGGTKIWCPTPLHLPAPSDPAQAEPTQ